MIQLSNGILSLAVDEKGAQMRSLKDERTGREYLWQADAAVWGRTAPILFPAVGKMHGDGYCGAGCVPRVRPCGLHYGSDPRL